VFSKPSAGWMTEHQQATLPVPQFGSYGSTAISADGSTIAVGARKILVFRRPGTSWRSVQPTAQLTASGANGEQVGASVAMSADGSTIVAGAPAETATGPSPYAGALYVFTKPSTGWSSSQMQAARLTNSDGVQGDCFGCSVAISADGATVTGGGAYVITNPYSRGAAYVFTKPGGGWSDEQQAAKFTG
jgi:hypothetical protein